MVPSAALPPAEDDTEDEYECANASFGSGEGDNRGTGETEGEGEEEDRSDAGTKSLISLTGGDLRREKAESALEPISPLESVPTSENADLGIDDQSPMDEVSLPSSPPVEEEKD